MLTYDEMSTELMARYPEVLARVRGIEFREGWASIVDSMCQVLCRLDPVYQPAVVKEKFSILSVLGNSPSREAAAVCRAAEAVSARVCEIKGKRWRRTKKPKLPLDTIAVVTDRHKEHLELGDGIPEGYADIIDVAAYCLDNGKLAVRLTFGGLAFTAEPNDLIALAVCQFLSLLSECVDPETGAMSWTGNAEHFSR